MKPKQTQSQLHETKANPKMPMQNLLMQIKIKHVHPAK